MQSIAAGVQPSPTDGWQAEAPHTKVWSTAVDFLRDFWTMVWTSLQASWYLSERVQVAVWKPCIISWKASQCKPSHHLYLLDWPVTRPLVPPVFPVPLRSWQPDPVTIATCLLGPVWGPAPIASSAPLSPLTISWSPSLFPPWSLRGASSRSPSSSLPMVSGLYRGLWSCQAVDPVLAPWLPSRNRCHCPPLFVTPKLELRLDPVWVHTWEHHPLGPGWSPWDPAS